MKIPAIDYSLYIEQPAMPVTFIPAGGSRDNTVLLIHGYLGSPHELLSLGKELTSRGFAVSIPRLPGHGTSGNDLLTAGSRDWLRKTFDTCAELKSSCRKFYIAGYSMGSLLAVIAASEFKPDGLVLIAPAVTNYRRLKIYLSPLVMLFRKRIKRTTSYNNLSDFENKLNKEYWEYDWPASAFEILRLQKEAVKRLKKIRCRTLVLLSENDKTVPLKASDIIKKHIKADLLYEERLKSGRHAVFKDSESGKAVKIIAEWLESAGKN